MNEIKLTQELKSKRYCKSCSENYPEKIEKLEKENEELKQKKQKYYKQTLDDEIQIDELLQTLQEIREMTKKYDADVGDTIIANPIQDCYDIYCLINKVLESEGE